ncbi:MAG: hypothetical protein PHX78_04465 [bacterium]|nr:hypothetical protein [bacterium]
MKRFKWQILFGLFLIGLSAVFYFIHYLIFRDAHHIFLYLVGDIAFIPIEVLLVTFIIERFLDEREKKVMLNKMNMVIGAFFSEVGTKLLEYGSEFSPQTEKISQEFKSIKNWPEGEFIIVSKKIRNYEHQIEIQKGNLEGLRSFLVEKRNFLLLILQNPNLLEHETFTELLWAVFHLTEELTKREDVKKLTDADSEHLEGDIKRAYILLIAEWLDYMKHLKDKYPYLFSLAIRTNPFDPSASVEVK